MKHPARRFLVSLLLAQLLACSDSTRDRSDPVRHEVVTREVVHLVFGHGTFDAVMEQAADTAMTVMTSSMQAELKRELSHSEHQKLHAALRRVMLELYPQKMWEDAFIPIYMKYFDAQELEQLLEFFRTPIGTKLLLAQGKLLTEGAKAGEELVKTRMEEFVRRFQQEVTKEFAG